MRVLIVGCGYVGLALGRRLAASGCEVLGLRRSDSTDNELAAAGIRPVRGDVTRAEDLAGLEGDFDWVVNTVSSSRGGAEVYREVYLGAAQNLVAWAPGRGVRALAYTSSTSVYGQTDGSWVDESSPVEPAGETGRLLVATEEVFLDAARSGGLPSMVLRVGGIYGPGRGHLFRQFLAGEARLEPGGGRWINMIHRDDVAGALEAALRRGTPGTVYNAVDDEPVRQGDFLAHLARETGRTLPPEVEPEGTPVVRKRGITHKRVSNWRLRSETGWVPAFPDFRSGYAEEIRSARAVG
jgi:nucleoside-diphosphate-sugar epimerase